MNSSEVWAKSPDCNLFPEDKDGGIDTQTGRNGKNKRMNSKKEI